MSYDQGGGGGTGSVGALTELGTNGFYVGTAAFSVVSSVGSFLATLVTSLPIILGLLLVTGLMIPWVQYHDRILEEGEFFARTQLFPLYRDVIRPVADLIRQAFNPLICWWNALNWWGYGMVRQVLYPTVRDCGIVPIVSNAFNLLLAVVDEAILPVITGRFIQTYATWTQITVFGTGLAQAWIDLYTCACSDLGDILGSIPILNPLIAIPPVWAVTVPFSAEWADPNLWCALENAFNTALALLRQVLLLIQQVLLLITGQQLPTDTFIRPEFRDAAEFICSGLSCLMRSAEQSYQRFWDKFVPFEFKFQDYFLLVDTLGCIFVKTITLLVRILVNIDQCVTYPSNPFWEAVVKPDVVELINLWAAPTPFVAMPVPEPPNAPSFIINTYFLDPTSEVTPTLAPNPLFGKRRVTEAICIFITRTICDPSDQTTACFSQTAQQLLFGLDFCCLTNTVLDTLADIVSATFEFTLYLARGSDDFFLFVDSQPFSTLVKDGLVKVVRCILSIFTLIPVVGTCIRDLITGIVEYLLCLIDFAGRVIIGLATLPYYIIVLDNIPNFLQKANEALDFFVEIHANLVADVPNSVKNCLTVILNEGFPVPPVPCSSCEPGGFVPPPTSKRNQLRRIYENGVSPISLYEEIWGEVKPDSPLYRITPLMRYANHTTNPITIASMLMMNAHVWAEHDGKSLLSLRTIDSMVDDNKQRLLQRWATVRKCNAEKKRAHTLRAENPRRFAQEFAEGKWQNTPECPNIHAGAYFDMMPKMGDDLSLDMHRVQHERLTLGPLEPNITGCDPTPPCFDLSCLPRTILDVLVLILQIVARFFNGLIQGSSGLQGTMQDFPYFTGEFCDQGKPCFQSDITNLILAVFRPIKCVCQALNLIIPVTPREGVDGFTEGRPDICCAVQRISELIACIVQVLFNTIEGIALGKHNDFAYFRAIQPGGSNFRNDVNILFDITLEVVECLCIFLTSIFPLNFIPGFAAAVDFDPCCIPQALITTLIEIVRGILQVIITLATITIDDDAVCYWRLDRTLTRQCSGRIDDIGIIVQTDRIIDSFLPQHGENGGACLKNCNADNGASGIVPCICQLFNTLIPFRRFPNKRVDCSDDQSVRNCQEIDFCCPFSKLGFFIADSLKFINRGLVTLWQPWSGGLPEFFLAYIFCSEGIPPRCPPDERGNDPNTAYINERPNLCAAVASERIPDCAGTYPLMNPNTGMVEMRCGEFLCGRMNIIIKDLTDPYEGLLARCTCQFFGLLDRLMALLFRLVRIILPFAGWSCCFCGGLTASGDCKVNGGFQCDPVTGLCEYKPTGPCDLEYDSGYNGINNMTGQQENRGNSGVLTALSYVAQAAITALVNLLRQFPLACYWKPFSPITQVSETWIFSFLGPTANALCIAFGNLMCFANSTFLLPRVCTNRGSLFLGSVLRWASEIIFRVIGFIEAFVRSFIDEDNTCVGPQCQADPDTKEQSYKGIQQSDLGKMMVILLSIPSDLLIGDSEVACTTVCPSFFAVPTPGACQCFNRARRYGDNRGEYYSWTNDNSQCFKEGEHVGLPFENTTGCCVLRADLAAGANPPDSPLPACQSPDDADLRPDTVYNATTPSLGFPSPGSCAVLGVCRPDALPSCANDPMTPPRLSGGYQGAVDGIVMGLMRYLRCILSNIICNEDGTRCTPLGLIFYPAMLIFSFIWQILGGVIRFIVASILFFFSLFAPPEGDNCSCYDSTEPTFQKTLGVGGTDISLTRYYDRVGGLCYPCRILGWECRVPTPVAGKTCFHAYPCASYCPLSLQLSNPGISENDAVQLCLQQYANPNITKVLDNLTPQEACLGCIMRNLTFTDPNNPQATCFASGLGCEFTSRRGDEFCTPGGSLPDGRTNCNQWGQFGTLAPFYGQDPNSLSGQDSFQRQNFFQHDVCPSPFCQWGYQGHNQCGVSNLKGFWKCGNRIFANSSPSRSLVVCGVIQIVQNFLEVFDAFIAIFSFPLIVPSPSYTKRSAEPMSYMESVLPHLPRRMVGPVQREPRQQFNRRTQNVRYSGTIYGLTEDFPNLMEVMSDALYNYDTSDCWDDPVKCACRNLDMPHHCVYDPDQDLVRFSKKRNHQPMQTDELTGMMRQEMFTGVTVCDHIIGDCANKTWDMISTDIKNQWIDCFDKYVRGDRLHHVASVFPTDFMYNPHALMEMSHNMYDGTKGFLARRLTEARERRNRKSQKRSIPEDKNDPDYIEPLKAKYPNFQGELIERMQSSRHYLETKLGIHPWDLMYDAIVKADLLHYKYQRGYYGHMVRLASRNIMEGRYSMPTTQQSLWEMRQAINEIKHVVVNTKYAEIVSETGRAFNVVSRYASEVAEEGVVNHVRNQFARYKQYRQIRFEDNDVKHTETLMRHLQFSPLYQWWNKTTTPNYEWEEPQDERYFASFRDHMSRTWAFNKQRWSNVSAWAGHSSSKNAVEAITLKKAFVDRWSNPKWTPQKLQNWESATRLYYQVYSHLWPHAVTRDMQERFLFLSNCPILDRTIELTTKVVDYCANEAMPNMKRIDTPDNGMFNYLRSTSPYRNDTFYNWKNIQRYEHVASSESAWIRPRLIMPNETHNPLFDVHFREYRRAMANRMPTNPAAGPANFNLFRWILRTLEDLFEFGFGARADSWFDTIQDFLTNMNTDINDVPDVGLLYVLRFSFVCNFPENINCSIGTGLETALLWCTVGFVVLVVVGALIFPLILLPFQIIGYGIVFGLVFLGVAFHFPAACLIVAPSFPLPFGFMFPECALDAIIEFADKWITNCYSPLILPAYMIAGEVCPVNAMQQIDVLNCADVGVSDGIQNILFLGSRLLGEGFCDLLINLAGTVFASIIPGLENYMMLTLDSFKGVSSTQRQRQWFCFWATLPTVFAPVLILFIGGLVAITFVVPLVLLINSLVQFFFVTPWASVIPGAQNLWLGPRPLASQTRGELPPPDGNEEEDGNSFISTFLSLNKLLEPKRKLKRE